MKSSFLTLLFTLFVVTVFGQWSTLGSNSKFSQDIPQVSSHCGGGPLYVAYAGSNDNYDLAVAKYDPTKWPNWTDLGIVSAYGFGFNVFEHNDTVYAAYGDGNASYALTVKKYDGSSWELVDAISSEKYVRRVKFAQANDTIFMGVVTYSGYVQVYKLVGGSFSRIANWRTKNSSFTDFDMASNGTEVSVVYENDWPNGVIVKKYKEGAWSDYSASSDDYPFYDGSFQAMAIAVEGTRTVVASRTTSANYLTIWEYDGTNNWTLIGDTIKDDTYGYSLQLHGPNTYVAYEAYLGSSATGMRMKSSDGTTWSTYGSFSGAGESMVLSKSDKYLYLTYEVGGSLKSYRSTLPVIVSSDKVEVNHDVQVIGQAGQLQLLGVGDLNYRIFDVTGALQVSGSGRNELTIALRPGVYVVEVNSKVSKVLLR